MENTEIRQAAKESGVKLWEIAERCGLNDGNFSRKLRHELPAEQKELILAIVNEIKEARRENP